MSKDRDWCFTSFQDDPPTYDVECMGYLVFQRESCPDTGREHWQGFVQFNGPVTLQRAKRAIACPDAHLERRRGTPLQAADYCRDPSKLADSTQPHTEFGELALRDQQGSRNDLVEIKRSIDEGASLLDVFERHFGQAVRYHRSFQLYSDLRRSRPRDRNTRCEVIVLIGPSRTGKTRWAYEHFPDLYEKDTSIWWPDYKQEETVLIDNIGPREVPAYNYLLRVCDRYPMRVQNKGGYTQLAAKRFIFTSIHPVDQWWGPFHDTSEFDARITLSLQFPLPEHKGERDGEAPQAERSPASDPLPADNPPPLEEDEPGDLRRLHSFSRELADAGVGSQENPIFLDD